MHPIVLSLLLLAAGGDDPRAVQADPKVVQYVLSSPARTWSFLLAADSGAAERLAVARSAGKVLDWTYLKRIDAAQAAAPSAALRDAWRSMFVNGDAETFFAYAAALPCASQADAKFFQKATTSMAMAKRRPMPPAIVGAWRNLLLRTDKGFGNALGPFLNTWALRFDDVDSWRAAHVLLLDRIDAGDVYGAAFHLYQLRERINATPGQQRPGPIPYTATLAVARRALSDRALGDTVRVMAGLGVARALQASYLPPDSRLSPSIERDRPELMRRFAEWFAPREQSLAEAAAGEAKELDTARKAMAAVSQCRAGERLASY